MQIGAGLRAQRQPLVDQRAVQPRVLAGAQDGVEHFERRLIRIAAVRHLVRDHHRAEFAGPRDDDAPRAGLRRLLGVDLRNRLRRACGYAP